MEMFDIHMFHLRSLIKWINMYMNIFSFNQTIVSDSFESFKVYTPKILDNIWSWKFGLVMEKSWKCFGTVMERSWKIHGNVLGQSWKGHGKFMEMFWDSHGKVMERLWKSIGQHVLITHRATIKTIQYWKKRISGSWMNVCRWFGCTHTHTHTHTHTSVAVRP